MKSDKPPLKGTIPSQSVEVGEALLQEFGKQLSKRAIERMIGRNSTIVTDADIKEAYGDLTIHSRLRRIHVIAGDSAMVVGGAICSFGLSELSADDWLLPGLLALAGIMLAAFGIYHREFSREPI